MTTNERLRAAFNAGWAARAETAMVSRGVTKQTMWLRWLGSPEYEAVADKCSCGKQVALGWALCQDCLDAIPF